MANNNQGMDSLLGGLAQGLTGYLQQKNKVKTEMGMAAYKNNLETQRQTQLESAKQTSETDRQKTLKLYELTLAGKVDPQTAATIDPDAAKTAQNFFDQNQRWPTVQEFDQLHGKPQAGTDSKQLFGYQKEYTKDINKEKESLMGIQTAGDQIKLAVNNPVAYNSVPITLARAFTGTSRINQVEIQKLGGSAAVVDKLNQIGTQMTKGTLTPDNAKYMADLTDMLTKSHQRNIEDLGVHHASMYRRVSKKDLPTAYQDVTGETMPDRFNHPLGDPNIQTSDALEAKKAALRAKLQLGQ